MALTALALLGLTRLTLSPDPLTPMYPEGHPFRPALEAIQKMAPEPAMLVAILERRGGDIYWPETIAKVDRITKKLMSTEWVLPTGVTSLTKGFTHYEYRAEGMEMEPVLGRSWPKTDRDFELLRRKVAVNPMGPGAYVSYDGTATMITAPLSDVRQEAEEDYRRLPDAEKTKVDRAAFVGRRTDAFFAGLRQLVKETRVEEEDTDHRLLFMGPQLIEAEMTAMGFAQLPVAAAATLIVILLLLTFHFRSLPGVLVPVLSMALSVVWGMGIFSLAETYSR